MPQSTPELIAQYQCEIGENPLWHPIEQKLYWCDIASGRLFRYQPSTGTHEMCFQHSTQIGGFTIQPDGSLLLFMEAGEIAVWRNGILEPPTIQVEQERHTRFNDVLADPLGRVFCGTMSTPDRKGRLYRLDPDGTIHLLLEDVGCSNGMALNLSQTQLYFTDSFAHEISIFDYDRPTGAISNRRLFARIGENEGLPDGATLDAEGCLWSARWDGGCIVRYSPAGEIIRKIPIPANKASSLTFAGTHYTDLYITTAISGEPRQQANQAGALFRIQPGVQGIPEFFSRIRMPR